MFRATKSLFTYLFSPKPEPLPRVIYCHPPLTQPTLLLPPAEWGMTALELCRWWGVVVESERDRKSLDEIYLASGDHMELKTSAHFVLPGEPAIPS